MRNQTIKIINKTKQWNAGLTALALFASAFFLPPATVWAANNVNLIVGGKKAAFVVSPYVSSSGTVMAPVDFVRLLGGAYNVDQRGALTITTASGRTFPTAYKSVQSRYMVPLQATAQALGATTNWSAATNTFTLLAKLEMARVDDTRVTIATSYPVYYKTQTIDNPARLVVDIYGANLDAPPATIPSDSAIVTHIRTGQLDAQTVRLVLDLAHTVNFQVASSLQTNAIQLALDTPQTDTQPVPAYSDEPPAHPVVIASTEIPESNAPKSPSGSVLVPLPSIANSDQPAATQNQATTKIVDIEYKSTAPNVYQIVVTTAGPINSTAQDYHSFYLDHPNRLAFDVANSAVALTSAAADSINSIIPASNPLFKSVRWGMVSGATSTNGRVVVDLLQPVVYTVASNNLPDGSGVQYTITIEQSAASPQVAGNNNSIAGKIVIVDAGHGGKDTGAPGAGGIYEKNFTLAIAKQVRDALIAAGATPIMTRSDDTFIPLDDRSQLGIDNHADFFISIHCDSSGEQNSHSGDTVYYHGNDSICRSMAKSIASRLAQLDISIQSDGVKSDYVRFPGVGFSVLRKSPEPAVLVECGYVNDDGDAKCLEDPQSLQQIATGIVAGLRDFVSNQ